MSRRTTVVAALLCPVVLALTACGSPGSGSTVTVLAASSLTTAFETLGADFEQAHPGVRVTFAFGASSTLATQITQGAPADVFAAASTTTMDAVTSAGAASTATPFATNAMAVAVPAANPAKITALADLARPGVTLALCQPDAPCGATAAKVLANAHLTVRPVTEEADAKATLTKVVLGEVDAALVYVTDVRAAGATVRGIEIPAEVNASTTYPIASLTGSTNPALARAFVDYVLSPSGRDVLSANGFGAP